MKRLPFAERLIGSIRRECLNHAVVLGEQHLRRTLARYFAYYHGARTHLSLDKDAPYGRSIEQPELGGIIPIREVGGLHTSLHPTGGLTQPNPFTTLDSLGSGRSPPTLDSFRFVGATGLARKRLAVLPPTRYQASLSVPWPVTRARAMVNPMG